MIEVKDFGIDGWAAQAQAALSGRFALEQTFLVPRDALLLPHKSPVQILEALSGTPLTS